MAITKTITTGTDNTAAELWRIAVAEYHEAEAGRAKHRPTFEEAERSYFANREDANEKAAFAVIEADHNAWIDEAYDARTKLLTTPAPDADAMLYKLELLADLMRECDEQDADSVAAIRDDAKRLFGGS